MNSGDKKFLMTNKQVVDLAAVAHAVEDYLDCTDAEAEANSFTVTDEEMPLIRTYKHDITFNRHMLQDILQYIKIKANRENERSQTSNRGFQIGDLVRAMSDGGSVYDHTYIAGDEGIVTDVSSSGNDVKVRFQYGSSDWCRSESFCLLREHRSF